MRKIYALIGINLLPLLVSAAKEAAATSPSIPGQIINAGFCIIDCGPFAILFIILPAIAVFIWKKIFSIG